MNYRVFDMSDEIEYANDTILHKPQTYQGTQYQYLAQRRAQKKENLCSINKRMWHC